MITCKNCNHDFDGNFCNICGQKAKTARLDWHYLSDEAKYTFLHFNGGFTYSVKQLVTRPGHTVREFIEGKRVHHYKPILLLFVLAGIYGLLMHYIDMNSYFGSFTHTGTEEQQKKVIELQNKIFEWQVSHYSLIEIVSIPVVSLASWLAFRKWRYNFIEHIILNSFSASLRLLFNIAVFPLFYYSIGSAAMFPIHALIALIGLALTFWTYIGFFGSGKIKPILGRLMLFLMLILVEFVIMMILFSLGIIFIFGDKFGIAH